MSKKKHLSRKEAQQFAQEIGLSNKHIGLAEQAPIKKSRRRKLKIQTVNLPDKSDSEDYDTSYDKLSDVSDMPNRSNKTESKSKNKLKKSPSISENKTDRSNIVDRKLNKLNNVLNDNLNDELNDHSNYPNHSSNALNDILSEKSSLNQRDTFKFIYHLYTKQHYTKTDIMLILRHMESSKTQLKDCYKQIKTTNYNLQLIEIAALKQNKYKIPLIPDLKDLQHTIDDINKVLSNGNDYWALAIVDLKRQLTTEVNEAKYICKEYQLLVALLDKLKISHAKMISDVKKEMLSTDHGHHSELPKVDSHTDWDEYNRNYMNSIVHMREEVNYADYDNRDEFADFAARRVTAYT